MWLHVESIGCRTTTGPSAVLRKPPPLLLVGSLSFNGPMCCWFWFSRCTAAVTGPVLWPVGRARCAPVRRNSDFVHVQLRRIDAQVK
ncbi:hypothetical protein EYF80_051608 [Liparis tanakae]|uniref:Uncharacterized protein n=1 Tax=Liparis tanakae TaxID=230148 RepID=A0A4Z2FAF0_9TELE|nr:hypothetical protein EYF80_051608 [Liparis tanakae]